MNSAPIQRNATPRHATQTFSTIKTSQRNLKARETESLASRLLLLLLLLLSPGQKTLTITYNTNCINILEMITVYRRTYTRIENKDRDYDDMTCHDTTHAISQRRWDLWHIWWELSDDWTTEWTCILGSSTCWDKNAVCIQIFSLFCHYTSRYLPVLWQRATIYGPTPPPPSPFSCDNLVAAFLVFNDAETYYGKTEKMQKLKTTKR